MLPTTCQIKPPMSLIWPPLTEDRGKFAAETEKVELEKVATKQEKEILRAEKRGSREFREPVDI